MRFPTLADRVRILTLHGSIPELSVCKAQGGTLISSYTGKLRSFFGVQNFEFQYFFGCSEKLNFFGHEDSVDIFGGSSHNWTILRGHFYAF